MKNKDVKIKAQIEIIEKGTDEAVISALKSFRKDGSMAILPAIINRWNNSSNDLLNKNILSFMNDLRPQEALEEIMNSINNPNYIDLKNLLLSILWQSTLDASEYLVELISVALNGDYLTVLEVSTVIESFDTVFNEQDIMEITYQLDERMEEESNEGLRDMLNSLKSVISKLPVE